MNNQPSFAQQMLDIQTIAKKSKIEAKSMFDPKLKEKYDQAVAAAQPIIKDILHKSQKAAADDKDGCEIMRLKKGEDEGFSDYTSAATRKVKSGTYALPADQLGATAKQVFMHCMNVLKVHTEVKEMLTSMDERGETYYGIWIYWKPKATTRAV